MQPTGNAGQVQVDLRLQLILQAEAAQAQPRRDWPVWPVATEPAVLLFATPAEFAAEAAVSAQASATEPSWRLWGVWTQAGQTQAVLGRGLQWRVLAPGQNWAPTAYHLHEIGIEGARLRGPQAQQLVLPWQEGGAP